MIECEYGNNKRDVRKNSASVSQAKKSAKNKQFGGVECVLHILGNGSKWRSLGKNWHTIYTRANRWAKNNVLGKIFIYLQKQGMISLNKRILCLDSTCIKVHPDSHGALKKNGQTSDRKD